ncbi:MAG: TolB family protein [Anaerolineae bacterium]
MNTDGSEQTNLTDSQADDTAAAWSPDGQQMTFMSNRNANWEIYVMNIDGSGQTNLTNSPADDRSPEW